MGDEPAYMLTRGADASVRLNMQHYMFKDIIGYLLHPSITILPAHETLRIADLGTGTGVWPLDVVQSLGANVQVDGYDVSADQYPIPQHLPTNVRLSVWDCVDEEPPAHLHESYDIVHIRLFLGVIRNGDPSSLLRNALKLLKPGGYLQWVEADTTRLQVRCAPGGTADACRSIVDLYSGVKDQRWVPRLPTMFLDAGLDAVHSHATREHAWQRRMFSDMMCTLANEIVAAVYGANTEVGKVRRMAIAEAAREIRNGAWFSQPWLVAVGRKPKGQGRARVVAKL